MKRGASRQGDRLYRIDPVPFQLEVSKRQAQIDEAIKADRMKPSEGMKLLDDYERGLKGYTYLSI